MALGGIVSSLISSKPKIPKMPKTDLVTEQQKAIAANQAALPGAEELASDVNDYSYSQIQKFLTQAIPGLSDINATASGNILSQLKGELPQDVQDQIMRSSAFKALRQGGGQRNSIAARDLGLTSLELSNRALDSATKWIASARSLQMPQLFDVSSMFITPLQTYTATNEQNVQQFQRQMAVNQNDASFSWGNRLGPLADAAAGAGAMFAGSVIGGGAALPMSFGQAAGAYPSLLQNWDGSTTSQS